jgi:hypothetical protein
MVRSQPGHIICETLSQKTLAQNIGLVGLVQGEGPEFKPQYQKKERKKIIFHPFTLSVFVFASGVHLL